MADDGIAPAEAPYARMDAPAEPGQDAGPASWFRGFQCSMPENLSFKTRARQFSTGVCLCMFLVPIFPGISTQLRHLPNFLAQLLVASAIGCLEIPFCFSFVAVCRRLQVYLAPFERYLLRGVLYVLFAVSMALINIFTSLGRDWLNWIFVAVILMCGIGYVLAYFNGENAETGVEGEEAGFVERTLSGVVGGGGETDESELKKQLHKAALRAAMSTAV